MTDDRDQLRDIVLRLGVGKTHELLTEFSRGQGDVLTIISNAGLHRPPPEFLVGEVYHASNGDLPLNSVEEVSKTLDTILLALRDKLLSRKWSKIYLIPFGPAVISMAIKLAVFRVLWTDTVDIFYFGNGEYGAIERDSRASFFSETAATPPEN